ncbi:helix-turn-helix transcriptional regulator [Mycolicibacterium sp. XJ870]
MVTIDEFSRVVSEIYASSINPANWPVALSEIGRVLDASGCAIYIGRGTSRSLMSATVPSEARESYTEHFYTVDYILEAVEKGPGGLIHGGQALVALRTHSEFESDFLRPHHMDDGLFMQLNVGTTPASFLAAAPKRQEPFDTAERVKFVSAVTRHLQQSLRTQDHLAELRGAAEEIAGVIEAVRHGVVIVGPGRTVAQLNSVADRIIKSGDGLCIRDGSVEATCTSTDEQLQRSITGALVEQRCGSRSGDTFVCSRPSGKRPYVIHVLPLPLAEGLLAAKALVMIIDPEQDHEPPKVLIRRLFGLTNSEADVALRVMRGDGLKPISLDLALSRATVNTHLQHIFDKTDTHRQAELVRLLLAIIP